MGGMRMWICYDRFVERTNPVLSKLKHQHAMNVNAYLHVPIVTFLGNYRCLRAHFLAWWRYTRDMRRRYRQKLRRAAERLRKVNDAWDSGDIDKYVTGAAWHPATLGPTQNMSLTENVELATEGSTSPEFHSRTSLRRLKLKRGKFRAHRKGLKSVA